MTMLEPSRPGERGGQPLGAPAAQGRPLGLGPDGMASRLAAAFFLLDGHHVAIVPRGVMSLPEAAVLGSLVLEGRSYALVELRGAPVPDMLDLLSPRELEVALLVAEGRDAKAIARRLRISFYTVRVHLGRIYGKLGLHKQTELTACVAARYGALWGRQGGGAEE
ncbi:helix-turn-helix transcriptional regulator [Roseomonas sp. E05]|uniref:helix-turn-helix transcriptional regulator n=1 Tax=Roseomonas sp. E05 TaxID=3046310 RepID=UPI0024BA2741|nr:helix-turn-helix transcriptional regulator [Roseomonas sp. E05]MDJ0386932.1 helix-turn-helix transcriptional regulator [Roseomonas sp. E05]